MDTQTRNHILAELVDGKKIEAVAADHGISAVVVRRVADDHGWPSRATMAAMLREYREQEDNQARPRPIKTAPQPLAAVEEPKPRPAPVPASLVADEPLVELLEQAAASPVKRTRTLAERITRDMADLRARIQDDQAKAEARAEVQRLEEQLAAAKERARLKTSKVGTERRREQSRKNMAAIAAAHSDYDPREVRAWAKANNVDCPVRGRYLPRPVVQAWRDATGQAAS